MKYRIVLTLFILVPRLETSTCPECNGTRSEKSGMVFRNTISTPLYYDITSGSDITSCYKIDKPLLNYIFWEPYEMMPLIM